MGVQNQPTPEEVQATLDAQKAAIIRELEKLESLGDITDEQQLRLDNLRGRASGSRWVADATDAAGWEQFYEETKTDLEELPGEVAGGVGKVVGTAASGLGSGLLKHLNIPGALLIIGLLVLGWFFVNKKGWL